MQLVLSLFSGVGLLDRAFKEKGFCVVSAGDLIYGHDIRDFAAVKNKFDGVIGGSPCQDFSTLKRERGTYSLEMINEFIRVVKEAQPTWWLLENVKGVPDIEIDGYSHQRIDINQGWYSDTSRLRHIQFGHKDSLYLDIPKGDMSGVNHSCALATDDRSFRELCYLQGLESDYDLPDFNMVGKKKAVGNGVPLVIGRVLADAVKKATGPDSKAVTNRDYKTVTDQYQKRCSCGCKRVITGRKTYYDSSCRKRAERKRKSKKSLAVSLSGGQDSTAMLVKLLELQEPVKYILFCDTGYEFPQMYDYIKKLDEWLFKNYNMNIITLKSKRTMTDWAFVNPIKSIKKPENSWKIGRLRGLPKKAGMDYCTRDLKVLLLEDFVSDKTDIIECVGITMSEPKRATNKEKRYPLREWGWDEHTIQDYLMKKGLYNSLYDHFHRTGCFMCPKQRIDSWYSLYYHYNDLFNHSKGMEAKAKKLDCLNITFRDDYSLIELENRFKNRTDIPNAKLVSWTDPDISCFCERKV
jgi:DNA (cytosine-5)-methyltransferase 1